MLVKILAIGLVTVIINLILKQYNSEFSMIVNICAGLIIFFIIVDSLMLVLGEINIIGESSGISSNLIKIIIKIISAGYLTEFCADIAEDSGNKFVASKLILGGKIVICVMAFPIIKTLFQTIISLI